MLHSLEQQEQAELLREMSTKEYKFAESIKGDKGEKGDTGNDGYTPLKGKDYFTDGDIKTVKQGIREEVTPVKGVHYFDGKDGKPGKNGVDGQSIEGRPGRDGLDGKDGKNGKDGENASIDDIVKELKDKKLLELRDIKGARLDRASGGFNMNDQRWHGGGSGGGGTIVTAGTGILVTGDGSVGNPYVISIYSAPSITLATSPSAGAEEIGSIISSVDLNATTVKNSSPITGVTFFRNASLIHTQASPLPNGGLESYTDTTPVTTTTTYTAKVTDGTTTVTSNSQTFTFVSAYYYGVAAPGLDISSDGGGLTKLIQSNKASTTTTTSPTAQVYYFCYPDSYPALTSILDKNGFETISDYVVTTGITVTNSFGQTNTYRKYEFDHLTTQVNFNNTYKE